MTRLNHKFALAFTVATIIVLGIALTITSDALQRSTTQNSIGSLHKLNKTVISQTLNLNGDNFKSNLAYTKIQKVTEAEYYNNYLKDSKHHAQIFKTYNKNLLTDVNRIQVTDYFKKNNAYYKITSNNDHLEIAPKYLNAVLMVFVWIFVFLITLSIVVSNIISLYILDPFYKSLQVITEFRVNDNSPIEFKDNSTFEFRKLNTFLGNMMKKSRSDYQALKEFTENASHELQTPLAIMKAKIDNLIQTPLQENQLQDVESINLQIYKLTKIKTSLTTLMHLENYEPKPERNSLSEILNEKLFQLEDIFEMNEINLTTQIQENCFILMEKNWIEITLNNLLNNAIKHNDEQKQIQVILNNNSLIIKNTGKIPTESTEKLFVRFKSNASNSNSTGIGLSIVQKIIEIHNYHISYLYQENMHIVKISW